MALELVDGLLHTDEVLELFEEYTGWIVAQDAATAAVLGAQGYAEERAALSERYGPPGGKLLLALADGEPAGCAALHAFGDDGACELKRLYVREAYRGCGAAGALVRALFAFARERGYTHVLLDTLPFMGPAIAMYERLGFRHVGAYYPSPYEGTIYMRLDLGGGKY